MQKGLPKRTVTLRALAIYCIGTVLFSSAAAYNGYPLVFWDSGSYLRAFIEWHNLPDRPIFYSIFVGLLHWRFSLWPIVVGQSLICVFVVDRTLAHLAPGATWTFRLAVLVFLTVATSLPWFTGQIMPDFITPLLVPIIYLVVLERDQLSRWEHLLLLLLLTGAIATHYTHVALALALLALLALISLRFEVVRWKTLAPVALSTVLAISSIYLVNYLERREIVFAPYNSIFLFDRLLSFRTAQPFLARTCPVKHYEICPYLDELNGLPPTSGRFMWNEAGVLPKVGGAEHYRFEAETLVREIIIDAPLKHLLVGLRGAGEQLLNFPTGSQFQTYGPETQIYRILTTYFHHELGAYLQSKEYTGALEFNTINAIDVPVGYFSMAIVIGQLFLGFRARDRKLLVMLSMVIALVVGNAFLCGGLSSGDTRYQSRLMPLIPIVVAAGVYRRFFNRPGPDRPVMAGAQRLSRS